MVIIYITVGIGGVMVIIFNYSVFIYSVKMAQLTTNYMKLLKEKH